MSDVELLAILAIAALVTIMLGRETRARPETARVELARLRLIADRIHREETMPFE